MNKKLLAVVAVIFSLLMVFVAGTGYFGYTKYLKPQMAFKEANKNAKEVQYSETESTNKFKVVLSLTGELEGLQDDIIMDVKTTKNDKLDANKDIYYSKSEEKSVSEVLGNETTVTESYYIDGKKYLVKNGEKREVTGSEADKINSVEEELEDAILGSFNDDTEYEYIGETEIEGKKVYEYKVTLTDEFVDDFISDLTDSFKEGFRDDGSDADLEVEYEGVEYTLYVDKKDSTPVKEIFKLEKLEVQVDDVLNVKITDLQAENVHKSFNKEIEIKL